MLTFMYFIFYCAPQNKFSRQMYFDNQYSDSDSDAQSHYRHRTRPPLPIGNWFLTPSQPFRLYQGESVTEPECSGQVCSTTAEKAEPSPVTGLDFPWLGPDQPECRECCVSEITVTYPMSGMSQCVSCWCWGRRCQWCHVTHIRLVLRISQF